MTIALDSQISESIDLTHWPQKVDLIGVHVSNVDYGQAVDAIVKAAHDGEKSGGVLSCRPRDRNHELR